MRLLVLSDLHLEIWGESPFGVDLARSCPDVIVLAGDIHAGAAAVPWAEQAFPDTPVLYVCGNHEGHRGDIDAVQGSIAEACVSSSMVTFLHDSERIIDGVRFIGTPLWTDFELFGKERRDPAMVAAQWELNDYKLIRVSSQGERKLRPVDTADWHQRHRSWLASRLSIPFDGQTVVVTHMAPSMKSVEPRYSDDLVSAAYASNLDVLVAKADLWIHGHMHRSLDYQIGRCRVICNPRGYPGVGRVPENAGFDPNLIVELAGEEIDPQQMKQA